MTRSASPTPPADASLVPTESVAVRPKVGTPNPNSTWWKAPPTSKIRKTAMKILALRIRQIPDAEIATMLGLASGAVVRGYMHRAYKNGWLTDELDNPRDQIEYEIMHKVVRNMGEALDSADDERRDKMTVEVAKGTIFKTFDQASGTQAPPLNLLAIKIEMPTGAPVAVREGTIGGQPAFVDAEVNGGEG